MTRLMFTYFLICMMQLITLDASDQSVRDTVIEYYFKQLSESAPEKDLASPSSISNELFKRWRPRKLLQWLLSHFQAGAPQENPPG